MVDRADMENIARVLRGSESILIEYERMSYSDEWIVAWINESLDTHGVVTVPPDTYLVAAYQSIEDAATAKPISLLQFYPNLRRKRS